MIPNMQPGNLSDPGIRRLVDEIRELKEEVRRLRSASRTYAIRGEVTAWTSPSPTLTVVPVDDDGLPDGDERVLGRSLGYTTPVVGDLVYIFDLPGSAFVHKLI